MTLLVAYSSYQCPVTSTRDDQEANITCQNRLVLFYQAVYIGEWWNNVKGAHYRIGTEERLERNWGRVTDIKQEAQYNNGKNQNAPRRLQLHRHIVSHCVAWNGQNRLYTSQVPRDNLCLIKSQWTTPWLYERNLPKYKPCFTTLQ